MRKRHALILGGAAALLGACIIREPSPPPPPVMTPAAGSNVPPPNAVETIATARCDLALRCNQIGAYSPFMTYDHCMNLMRARGEFRQCPQGVDPRALDRCIANLSAESCERADFHGVDRFNACSDGYLCYP